MNATNDQNVTNIARILRNLDDDYLCRTFEISSHELALPIKKAIITVCPEGDLSTGRIAGFVDEWWDVSELGAEKVSGPSFRYSVEGDAISRMPKLKIVFIGSQFLLGEKYGTQLACRRSGLVSAIEQASSFAEFPIIWRWSPTLDLPM